MGRRSRPTSPLFQRSRRKISSWPTKAERGRNAGRTNLVWKPRTTAGDSQSSQEQWTNRETKSGRGGKRSRTFSMKQGYKSRLESFMAKNLEESQKREDELVQQTADLRSVARTDKGTKVELQDCCDTWLCNQKKKPRRRRSDTVF